MYFALLLCIYFSSTLILCTEFSRYRFEFHLSRKEFFFCIITHFGTFTITRAMRKKPAPNRFEGIKTNVCKQLSNYLTVSEKHVGWSFNLYVVLIWLFTNNITLFGLKVPDSILNCMIHSWSLTSFTICESNLNTSIKENVNRSKVKRRFFLLVCQFNLRSVLMKSVF